MFAVTGGEVIPGWLSQRDMFHHPLPTPGPRQNTPPVPFTRVGHLGNTSMGITYYNFRILSQDPIFGFISEVGVFTFVKCI